MVENLAPFDAQPLIENREDKWTSAVNDNLFLKIIFDKKLVDY